MIHICRQGLHIDLNCLISPVSHQSFSLETFYKKRICSNVEFLKIGKEGGGRLKLEFKDVRFGLKSGDWLFNLGQNIISVTNII